MITLHKRLFKLPNDGVFIISWYDYPSHICTTRRIDGLLYALTSMDIHVSVCAPLFHSEKPLKCTYSCEINRIDLRFLRKLNPEKFLTKIIAWVTFSFLATIETLKSNKKYSIIQFQNFYSFIPALTAKIFLGKKIVGDDLLFLWDPHLPLNLVYKFINYIVLMFTDVVIVPRKFMTYNFVKEIFPHKEILLLQNGVFFSQKGENSRKSKIISLVFVGKFDDPQNAIALDNIFYIAERLSRKHVHFEVLIVGGPSDAVSRYLDHKLVRKGIVKFLGYVSYEKLKKIYSSSLIGLLPYFDDTPMLGGQRTKALEYFESGLLVVSGSEGIKGIRGLKQGTNYLLANTIEEMFEILDRCLTNFKKYEEIANAGTKFMLENYFWGALTKEYIDLVNGICKNDQAM